MIFEKKMKFHRVMDNKKELHNIISTVDFLRRSCNKNGKFKKKFNKKIPFKKTVINKRLRNSVWIKFLGENFKGLCYSCGLSSINVFDYHCGHVKSEATGGPTILNNLRPICSSCNYSAGMEDMRNFAIRNGFDSALICSEHNIGQMIQTINNQI